MKRNRAPILFLLTAFLGVSETTLLRAQEAEYRPEYRIEEGGRFIQLLRWEEEENALYYEVEIEKQAGELWEGTLRRNIEAPFLEVSLPPGTYRYRVIPYDLLERPVTAPDWIQFEVLPAKDPVISRFSPEGFYLDEDAGWVLNLSGRNLVEGMQVYLQRHGSETRIQPRTVTAEGLEDGARLVFDFNTLDTGEYAIHAVNPGGLETSAETFQIAFRKPVDINISAGYRPLVSLYGRINELFETAFFPTGAYSRLGVIPFKRRWGYIGFELEPSWNYLVVTQKDYTVEAHIFGAAVYGVYQRWLSNRVMAFDFRIGGGIYPVLDYHFTFDRGATEPLTILIPAIAAGVSFKWFIRKPFFVETGLDFTHFFTVDDPSPGYLRPFAGAGWQF